VATGYQKILTLIHKKNEKVVSEVSSHLTYRYNSANSETTLKPQGFQPIGPEVSREQATTNSLSNDDPGWVGRIVELAITGKLTEPVPVSVKPSYQHILGEPVWFCPNLESANDKAPDLAFIPEELPIIIPLLIENRELALPIITAKKIFGGTIMEGSSELEVDEPEDGPPNSLLCPEPKSDKNPDHYTQLPSPGRHLVIIRSVKAVVHNYPEYTCTRARMWMEILEGTDAGKILVDNIGLPHPKESKGMERRRLLIAKRLGLIIRGPNGEAIQRGSWKLLEGVVCWVYVAYKTLGGRKVLTVDNYELMENDAHTQPEHPLPLAGAEEEPAFDEYHDSPPPSTSVTLPAVPATTFLNTSGCAFTCVDCSHFEANHGLNPRQGWGRCSKRNRGRYGCATACEALELVKAHGGKVEVQH